MNILVVKNRAMGDAIMGLGGLQYLKKMFPDAHITYALPKWIVPLFSNTNCAADDFLELELNSFCGILRSVKKIIKSRPNLIIEMHQSGRTAKLFKILPFQYKAYNHQKNDRGPAIQRDLDGIWLNNFSSFPRPNFLDFTPQLRSNKIGNDYILLGVVASRWTKIWPIENYLQLMRLMPNEQFVIPLSFSKIDSEIEKQLLPHLPPNALFQKRPINELPEIVAQCKFYLGNDTGLKHLSVALGKKTFTFFGPEEPLEWHPYDSKRHPYFFISPLECRTKTAHFCGLNICESMICLNKFTPEIIAERIQQDVS